MNLKIFQISKLAVKRPSTAPPQRAVSIKAPLSTGLLANRQSRMNSSILPQPKSTTNLIRKSEIGLSRNKLKPTNTINPSDEKKKKSPVSKIPIEFNYS